MTNENEEKQPATGNAALVELRDQLQTSPGDWHTAMVRLISILIEGEQPAADSGSGGDYPYGSA